ncbi:1-phosphatidylinositol 4,5-bisphosphate phosphodiesterase delta-4-like isoform X2 [Montipora capricornis]|uniref:1-phosphatidylinositol 4,5-bisphosphate phosphodiesterase delta-4-like isoform X2 n=1 Tax=Montipora capricornis TaxID=246305 RepID=UPI0035F17CCC
MDDENDNSLTSVQDCWRAMQHGSKMIKLDTSGKGHAKKTFSLDEDMTGIRYAPSRKELKYHIAQMAEVLFGDSVRETFQGFLKKHSLDNCISIQFRGNGRLSLNMVAESKDVADIWVRGLQKLIVNQGNLEEEGEQREQWLEDAFEKFDKNKDGSLGLKEIQRLLEGLNVKMSPAQVKKKFKEVNTDGDAVLNKNEFANFFKSISTRKEIVNLMKRFSSNGAHMTVNDFRLFLITEQGMCDASKEYCEEMIKTYEPTESRKRKGELGIDGLTNYLKSPEGDIFNPAHDEIFQDMTHPFTDYFIASSHNTYLLQDQWSGPSSVDAYINALRKGCRCVELDCWDGGNEEPVVYHGHTLTSKILFKDVIEAVSKHAFEVSEYPVILSLENHCNIENQKKMAEYLESILGDVLYKVPVDAGFTTFPSPEFFKNRILVKGKKLKTDEENDDDEGVVTDEDEAADIDQEKASALLESNAAGAEGVARASAPSTSTPPMKRKDKKPKREEKGGKKSKKQKLAKEFSRCVNYVCSVGFKGFEHAKQNYKFHQMSSFAESKMTNLVNSQGGEFVQYNQRQLSRIYPAGGRVDSSNYNPQHAWNAGCQIVALNYQTDSEPMHLNQGKYRTNGRAGYLLKPQIMRERESKFNPNTKTEIPGVEKMTVSIKVISAQQLPKPADTKGETRTKGEVIDPYVKVDFHGIPADTASFKTKAVKDNGFNPVWEERFEKLLLMPDLVMIRFAVFDEDVGLADDFIGQFSVPFTSIRPGYRHIQLLGNKGESLGYAMLFVHIEINGGFKFHRSSVAEAASPRISTS